MIILTLTLKRKFGPVRESNPGPLVPKAKIISLDQQAKPNITNFWTTVLICYLDSAGVITPVLRCLVVNSPAPLITVFSASGQWSNSDSSLRRDIQCGDFIEDASESYMTWTYNVRNEHRQQQQQQQQQQQAEIRCCNWAALFFHPSVTLYKDQCVKKRYRAMIVTNC